MKILVVEDEPKLAGFVSKGLQQAGYLVQCADSGTEALQKAASENFDLILLDLMLPGMTGIDVLKNLRAFKIATPVIIVSALGGTSQVVEGLDLGAVDYVRKPFEWDELLARIRIQQRKALGSESTRIRIADLVVNFMTRHVSRSETPIQLTAKEFALLEYLIRNLNRVVSKSQILENVWNIDFDPESNIVEVYMHQLRKKLDKGFETNLIETVIGVGYKFSGSKTQL